MFNQHMILMKRSEHLTDKQKSTEYVCQKLFNWSHHSINLLSREYCGTRGCSATICGKWQNNVHSPNSLYSINKSEILRYSRAESLLKACNWKKMSVKSFTEDYPTFTEHEHSVVGKDWLSISIEFFFLKKNKNYWLIHFLFDCRIWINLELRKVIWFLD